MDSLIALIVIIAIFNALTSSGRRRKREERTRAQADPRGAQPQAARTPAREGRAHAPYTREEWARYMRDIDPMKVGQASNAAPARGKAAPAPREDLRPAAPKVVAPAPVEIPSEGSVSTQGESAEEHAEHQRRAAAEEAERRQAHEALRDLRAANRDRLRAAIVMSEVLNKPVSLRPRVGLHR